jgi:hypothetical protein
VDLEADKQRAQAIAETRLAKFFLSILVTARKAAKEAEHQKAFFLLTTGKHDRGVSTTLPFWFGKG